MGGREVPFDIDEICDVCGSRGAYDFMGDLYCQKCVSEALEKQQERTRAELDKEEK